MENLEADAMVGGSALAPSDIIVLRREIAVRILLQNTLLIMVLLVFAAFSVLAIVNPETAWSAAAAHAIISFGAALQWCHHGIRTKQIKDYLMKLNGDSTEGWEIWLSENRPRTVLGSRWMISTKGVFLGLQASMIGLAAKTSQTSEVFFVIVAVTMLIASLWFLLTNPKE